MHGSAIVELNSETDFVAKNDQFVALAEQLAKLADSVKPANGDELAAATLPDGQTVAEAVSAWLRSSARRSSSAGWPRSTARRRRTCTVGRRDLPPAIGVLVEFTGTEVEAARGAAKQIAAMRPRFLTREDVPAELVAKEREIAEATAREEGKPEPALPKIVEGRLNGFFKDNVLLEQPSVQDNKKTVKAVLDEAGVTVTRFAHIEIGG